MTAMSRNPEAIARMIRDAQRIAICSHINPDGDTLGSAAAMRLALIKMGKDPVLFCDGKVPDQLSFLPGIEEMRIPDETEESFDLLLAVDVSDIRRLGNGEKLIRKSLHTAQIDHHPTNPLYGDVQAVDGSAAATCVLIHDLMGMLGVEADREIAECLYTGISTDTGNFLQDNTNEDALRVVAAIQHTGFSQAELGRRLFAERRPEQVALITRALQTLRYDARGAVTCMMLTRSDFEETGALSEDADTIVNFGRDIRGVHMAMLARETEDGVKMSLRSIAPYQVNGVAKAFGGGGHEQASGCTVRGMSLKDAADAVFLALQKALEEQT